MPRNFYVSIHDSPENTMLVIIRAESPTQIREALHNRIVTIHDELDVSSDADPDFDLTVPFGIPASITHPRYVGRNEIDSAALSQCFI